MKIIEQRIQLLRENTQLHSIEFLRGIASAMVCFFHLSCGNPRFLSDTSIVKNIGNLGWTGVEIFFIISGFIIPYSMYKKGYKIRDFFLFLKKRVIRIEPPYIISIILVIILAYISTLSPYYRGMPFHIDWNNVIKHLAYLNVFTDDDWLNPVYWSLAIEFQYYLLVAFCFPLIISGNYLYRFIFLALFLCGSFIPVSEGKLVLSYSGYFAGGILLFSYVSKIISSKEFWGYLILTFFILLYHNGIYLSLLMLCTILIIIYIDSVPKIFKKLGIISYSLYLLHVPIGGRIINISEVKIHNQNLRELMVFVSFGICILCAFVFYQFCEKKFKILSSTISYGDPESLNTKIVSSGGAINA